MVQNNWQSSKNVKGNYLKDALLFYLSRNKLELKKKNKEGISSVLLLFFYTILVLSRSQ